MVADETLLSQENEIEEHLSSTGGELVIADLRDNVELVHHNPKKLTSLFAHIASKTLLG